MASSAGGADAVTLSAEVTAPRAEVWSLLLVWALEGKQQIRVCVTEFRTVYPMCTHVPS